MKVQSGLKTIKPLAEGTFRNTMVHITIEGKELKGCGCCYCMPGVLGAGDETAKQSGGKVSGDVMILVASEAAGK
jgi:hypothetical protein